MYAVRAENICRTYGTGENAVKALCDVNFTIETGEMAAIMGPSGSGKSTLLHILGGIDKPTKGRVYINGMELYGRTRDELAIFRRRQVGIIYQYFNLVPSLNVEENIMLPTLLDGRKVDEDRMEEMLKAVGLLDKRYSMPYELSGGQQQRAAIGRALINTPAMLLADEATGNLDSINGQEIMELFKKMNRKYGQTIILITHDEDIALQAGRIITLDDGKLVRDIGSSAI